MNEKEVPETLESLEDDAGKLYGRLYEDQRIGGSATLDEFARKLELSTITSSLKRADHWNISQGGRARKE